LLGTALVKALTVLDLVIQSAVGVGSWGSG